MAKNGTFRPKGEPQIPHRHGTEKIRAGCPQSGGQPGADILPDAALFRVQDFRGAQFVDKGGGLLCRSRHLRDFEETEEGCLPPSTPATGLSRCAQPGL